MVAVARVVGAARFSGAAAALTQRAVAGVAVGTRVVDAVRDATRLAGAAAVHAVVVAAHQRRAGAVGGAARAATGVADITATVAATLLATAIAVAARPAGLARLDAAPFVAASVSPTAGTWTAQVARSATADTEAAIDVTRRVLREARQPPAQLSEAGRRVTCRSAAGLARAATSRASVAATRGRRRGAGGLLAAQLARPAARTAAAILAGPGQRSAFGPACDTRAEYAAAICLAGVARAALLAGITAARTRSRGGLSGCGRRRFPTGAGRGRGDRARTASAPGFATAAIPGVARHRRRLGLHPAVRRRAMVRAREQAQPHAQNRIQARCRCHSPHRFSAHA
jgi:hypothetical protein